MNSQSALAEPAPLAGQKPDDDFFIWALKKRYDDAVTQFRSLWDIYIKWYTAFIAFNVAALGFFLGTHIHENSSAKWIMWFFIIQNLMCVATSSLMWGFSARCGKHAHEALRELKERWSCSTVPLSGLLKEELLPYWLPRLGALFNAIGAALLLATWLIVA
jgi:hypothetical protein